MVNKWIYTIGNLLTIIILALVFEFNLLMYVPILSIINLILIIFDLTRKYIIDSALVKRIKDFKRELKGYRFLARPANISEIDFLYSEFQKIFGNDLLNKTELKKIQNKNKHCVWLVCQEFKNRDISKRYKVIGFFEIFPVRKAYEKKLILNDEDGRTLRHKDVNGSSLHTQTKFYLGSIGVIHELNNTNNIFKAAVLKEFKEFIYNLNKDNPITLYARPVTQDGKRLIDRYHFKKTDTSCLTYDCVWVLDLKKETIKYREDGTLEF